jgi:hypothetical protein
LEWPGWTITVIAVAVVAVDAITTVVAIAITIVAAITAIAAVAIWRVGAAAGAMVVAATAAADIVVCGTTGKCQQRGCCYCKAHLHHGPPNKV